MVDIAKYKDLDSDLCGKDGRCFVEENKIIKLYDNPIKRQFFHDLTSYKSSCISFPIMYIYENNYIIGEILPYFPYKSLDKSLSTKSSLELLIKNYKLIKGELIKYPYIFMNDLGYYGNVLYSQNKGFFLIDITYWKISGSNQVQGNLIKLDKSLFDVCKSIVCGDVSDNRILFSLRREFRKLRKMTYGEELIQLLNCNMCYDGHFIELVEMLREIISKYYDNNVKTIGDVKKYIKIMKNS